MGNQRSFEAAPSVNCAESRIEPEEDDTMASSQHDNKSALPPEAEISSDSVASLSDPTAMFSFSRANTFASSSTDLTSISDGDVDSVACYGTPPDTLSSMPSMFFQVPGVSSTPREPESTSTPCLPDGIPPTLPPQASRGQIEDLNFSIGGPRRRHTYHHINSLQSGYEISSNENSPGQPRYTQVHTSFHPAGLSNEAQLAAIPPTEKSVDMSASWPNGSVGPLSSKQRPQIPLPLRISQQRRMQIYHESYESKRQSVDPKAVIDASNRNKSGKALPSLDGDNTFSQISDPKSQESEERRWQSRLVRPSSPSDTSSPSDEDDSTKGENDEHEYQKLVQSINNLVIDSPCVDDIGDRGVPLELYIHKMLEQILNHETASDKFHNSHPPNHNLPLQTRNPGANVCGSQAASGSIYAGNGGRKRKNRDKRDLGRGGKDKDENRPDDDGDEGPQSEHFQAKRPKTGNKDERWSCPFRKRNPVRFNVRHHPQCALNSFQTFTLLKRHIQNFHRRPVDDRPVHCSARCPRCNACFPNIAAVNAHLNVPKDEMCESRSNTDLHHLNVPQDEVSGSRIDADMHGDPEDGITETTVQALAARKNESKIDSFGALWALLFPEDRNGAPSEKYEPPIELDEVLVKFYDRENLAEHLAKMGTLEPDEGRGHGYRYIPEVFNQCRNSQEHEMSRPRQEQDNKFLQMVDELLQGQPPAQQGGYVVVPQANASFASSCDPILRDMEFTTLLNNEHYYDCGGDSSTFDANIMYPIPDQQASQPALQGPLLGIGYSETYNDTLNEYHNPSFLKVPSIGGQDSNSDTLQAPEDQAPYGDQGGQSDGFGDKEFILSRQASDFQYASGGTENFQGQ